MSTSKFFSLTVLCFMGVMPVLTSAQQTKPASVFTSAAPSSANTDLVTIESLAEAQRRALLAKERDLKKEAAAKSATSSGKDSEQAASAARRRTATAAAARMPPPKTRLLHGIYSNAQGELIAEIVHNGVLKRVRDGHSVGGTQIEIRDIYSVHVRGITDPACKKKPCELRDVTLRIGYAF